MCVQLCHEIIAVREAYHISPIIMDLAILSHLLPIFAHYESVLKVPFQWKGKGTHSFLCTPLNWTQWDRLLQRSHTFVCPSRRRKAYSIAYSPEMMVTITDKATNVGDKRLWFDACSPNTLPLVLSQSRILPSG